LMMPIHNRMPAIIAPDKRNIWLNKEIQEPDMLMPLLKPYGSNEMEAYEVSKRVNSPSYNEPDCIEPATNEEGETLGIN